MPVKVSFKTGLLEFFNLICLLVVVLVIPIVTATAFQKIDENAMMGKQVLGVSDGSSSQVDATKDNTLVLNNISDKLADINNNTVSTKILIVVGAGLFALTIFLVVSLVSSVYKKPVEEKKEKLENNIFTEESSA